MVGWKDRRNNVAFIDLAPQNFALVHCRGDQITNSLAEEAKGGRVELSTMGSEVCMFHIFSVIFLYSVAYSALVEQRGISR
jgi:hypothetical protein